MNVVPTSNGSETLSGLGHHARPCWSTASFGQAADTHPGDHASLGEHLHLCHDSLGRLFGLQCGVEAVHTFLCGRVVTTLAVVLVVAAAIAFIVS